MGIEFKILDWIQSIRTPVTDVIMPLVSALGNAGLIWILTAIVLILIKEKRKSGIILIISLCIDVVLCNLILKNVFCRIRPCDINTAVELLIARPTDYSFPSGHTAAAFTAVSALYFSKERKLMKPALVTASLIAFSRMYLYVHYPTDILGGILVGIFAGYAGFLAFSKLNKHFRLIKYDDNKAYKIQK